VVVVSINGALVVVGAHAVVALGLKGEERWEKGKIAYVNALYLSNMLEQDYEEQGSS